MAGADLKIKNLDLKCKSCYGVIWLGLTFKFLPQTHLPSSQVAPAAADGDGDEEEGEECEDEDE